MPLIQGSGDLSVFTWDGNSLLTLIPDVSFEANIDDDDVSTVLRPGKRVQAVKKSVKINASVFSALSGDSGLLASNIAISAFTIGGTSYLAHLRGGSLKGSFEVKEASGAGDVFKYPQIFGKDYSADVNLTVPLTGSPNILRDLTTSAILLDVDLLDQDLVRAIFSITIDGTATTIPMSIKAVKVNWQNRSEANVTLTLVGNDPGTGAYPTAPTGTATLLEKAFNAYNTSIAMVLTTAATTAGIAYAGNFIITDFGFSFDDAKVIRIDYTFDSRGTITGTNGA